MSTKKRKSSSDGDGRPDAQKKAKCDAGAKDKGKGKKGGGGASVETKGVGRCGSGAGAGVEGLDVTVKGKGKRGVGGAAEAGSGSGGLDVTVEEHTRAVELLRGVQWERVRNTSRRNVLREEKFCMSFIFGRNMKDPDGGLSYWSLQYPELYAFFSALMQRVHPQHPFTNITVNKNLQCKRHTDGGNTGPSYIVAFGAYTGGRLFVEKRGGGSPKAHDLHRKFVGFEGSTQPHETEKYKGERYTAVFYTSSIQADDKARKARPAPSMPPPPRPPGAGGADTDTHSANATKADANGTNNANATKANATKASANGTSADAPLGSALMQRFQAMKRKIQGRGK